MDLSKASLRVAAFALALATAEIAWFSYSWSRSEAIEQLQAAAEQRADRFSLPIFAPTDKYAYLPNLVAEYEMVAATLQRPKDEQQILKMNLLLERIALESGAAAIYLMDADGMTLAASNWQTSETFVGNSYAFRPYFIDALRKGRGTFYGLGVTTRVPGYFISHVVKRRNAVLGVVVVKVDIRDLAVEWKTTEHEIALTDESGVVFLSSREEWKYRPMRPLSESTREKLKQTRQYETVLKEPLGITVEQELKAGEQVISLEQLDEGQAERASYFIKSRQLPESGWTLHVLTSTKGMDAEARRAAMLAVVLAALLLISSMFVIQVRNRNRERKESAHALEEALHALESKHAALQAVSEELRHASITDPLTGAYNRRFFMETAVKMVSAANRHKRPLAVIVVDVDHFKQINDKHGHPFGDTVLRTLAEIYMNELREDDIFARFGGEEFVVVLPNVDERGAHQVAERLREKVMNHPIPTEGGSVTITVSSGVSRHRLNEKTIDDTIKRADEALYKAKHMGRNCVEIQ